MSKFISLMFAASTLLLAGCCTSHHVTQWEYMNLNVAASKSITPQPEQHPTLNELGKEGWVVVGFTYVPGDSKEWKGDSYHYVLKRELQ